MDQFNWWNFWNFDLYKWNEMVSNGFWIGVVSPHVNFSMSGRCQFWKNWASIIRHSQQNAVWFVALFLFYVLFGFFLELTTSFFLVCLFIFHFFCFFKLNFWIFPSWTEWTTKIYLCFSSFRFINLFAKLLLQLYKRILLVKNEWC